MTTSPSDRVVHLARTWKELATLTAQPSDPLAIVEVLNRVTHRNWHFALWFDESNVNHMTLSTTPPLTFDDAAAIVDGTIAELFRSDAIEIRLDQGDTLIGEVRSCLNAPPADNVFRLSNVGGAHGDIGITLRGIFGSRLPAKLRDDSAVANALLSRTWFGCHTFASYRHEVVWQCVSQFGCRFEHRDWMSRPLGDEQPIFRTEISLTSDGAHIGNLLLATSPCIDRPVVFHGRFGHVDTGPFDRTLGNVGGIAWLMELQDPELDITPSRVLTPFNLGKRLVASAKLAIERVMRSDEFIAYQSAMAASKKRRQAALLKERQEHAQRRSMVVVRGMTLMCEPKCETEVMTLLAKLEALKALPLANFKLVEYTPREGIDALAHFQVTDTGQQLLWSPIELEYALGNFFAHEHPVEQVSMIICWKGDSAHPLDPISEGLYRLREGAYPPFVLILSKIPGIAVRE